MIVVTRAAGFIGSCMVQQLNNHGYKDLILVDDFSRMAKNQNFIHKTFLKTVHRDVFVSFLEKNAKDKPRPVSNCRAPCLRNIYTIC